VCVQPIDYIGFICLCMNALQKFFVVMSMNHGVSQACTDLHMNLCTIHGKEDIPRLQHN
jgi:hypothetical protein